MVKLALIIARLKTISVYDPSTLKLENLDEARSRGLKMKLKYDFGRGTYIAANYAYIDSENLDTGESNWTIPAHMGFDNDKHTPEPLSELECPLYISRADGPEGRMIPRNDMSDYTVVNTTLIAENSSREFEGLELAVTVNNLFDEDYSSPTSNVPINRSSRRSSHAGEELLIRIEIHILKIKSHLDFIWR